MIKKFLSIIEECRVPWIIKYRYEQLVNSLHYIKKSYVNRNNYNAINITFKCGFHGKTGGLYAIASIANMLSEKYMVKFVSYPSSNYNPNLIGKVNIVSVLNFDSDLYVLDVSCDHKTYKQIRQLGKPIIVTCHGRLNEAHGLTPDYVLESLLLSDITHFVNKVQQESFGIEQSKYTVIPNSTSKILKEKVTNNVGVVGNLDDEQKNTNESVEIFIKSNADKIHLWSCNELKYSHERVICHSWENNKNIIFNSFDVLVFMSKNENCPMVVIESLSAGIPCLLSAIPAHEQFKECPGVVLIDDTNRIYAHELLNELLERKTELRNSIIKFWELNYSKEAVSSQWYDLISKICS